MTYAPSAVDLFAEERDALRPAETISVAEWVEKYRVLPPKEAYPGRWRNWRTPYLVEPMNAVRTTRRVVFVASTQVGKTAFELNVLSWMADQEPGPTLWVLPVKDHCERFMAKRVKPAIESSPKLRNLLTDRKHDWKATEITVGALELRLAGANSAAGLSSEPARYLFLDEVDKFAAQAGREGAPIDLARERLRSYVRTHEDREVMSSTPTYVTGPIWQHWLSSDQRRYYVPCPQCGTYQTLLFDRDRVQLRRGFEHERDPDQVRNQRLAVYVCSHCEHRLEDDDDVKQDMLISGVWCPAGCTVNRDGELEGTPPARESRGYHLNALYSPFLTWSDVLAKFFEARDDQLKLLTFYNSWLGLPWQQKTADTKVEHVRSLASSHAIRTVPADMVVLTAGVDVQEHWLYYSIRAWGTREVSALVEAGRVETFEALALALFHTSYPVVGDDRANLPVRLACIDYQYRRDEVLPFCDRFYGQARPIRGRQTQRIPITNVQHKRDAKGDRYDPTSRLWSADTSYFKDKLHRFMHASAGQAGAWRLHAEPYDEYCQQLVAEHKVLVKRPDGTVGGVWQVKPGSAGAANHWLDTEVYNCVAAEMLGVNMLHGDTQPVSEFVKSLQRAPDHDVERQAAQESRRIRGVRPGGRRIRGRRP